MQYLLVFIGGGIGSLLRYLIGKSMNTNTINFPIGTFIINILGSLLIGILLAYISKNSTNSDSLKSLLVFGFCGGFTTFSAFSNETFQLLQNQQHLTAILYALGSIVLGIVATFAGYQFCK